MLLGQRLKPLTIGHLFLLERFECLPCTERDQLILAVIICSHDHDEVLPLFEDRWWNWKMRLWRWSLGKFDWMEKFELWDEYHTRSMETPCVISKHDSKGLADSATPFLQHLKVTLQSKLGYSPAEASPRRSRRPWTISSTTRSRATWMSRTVTSARRWQAGSTTTARSW